MALPTPSFVWGSGGRALTEEEIAREREIAAALAAGGADTSPVGHWTQGAARLVQALGGVMRERRADAAAGDNASYNSALIQSLLGGGSASPAASDSSSSAAMPMPGAAGEMSATMPGGTQSYRDAIASIESAGSGDYSAVGPTHPKMGRALGRYQVMEANIGPWSEAALGRAVTPDEFLASPELQDAIFDHQFGQYVQKYGPEGAAQAWFGGPGGVGKTDRKDVLGTTIGGYGQRFMDAIGQTGAQPVEVAGGGGRTGDYGELNPALLQALTDPRASPQTQRVAAMLYEQQARQQQAVAERQAELASPEYQIEMATKKAQLEKLNRELNTQGYDGVTVGNRIVDRNTGKVIYETPREQFRAATPEEAQGFGAPAGQFGPDGRFYPLNPPSGTSLQVDPNTGAVTFSQGSGAGVAKPLTEVQSKDVLYATRATNAMPIIDQYEGELLSLGGSLAEGIPMNLGNYAQSEQYQLARDAGRDFLATILRKDTGAAITSNEEQIYGKMFLPQPGDKPATVQAKRQRRALAVEAIKAGMPLSAIENMTKALGSVDPSTAPQDRGGTGAQKRLKFNPATGELE